jgi:hypothetical protein
MPEIRRFFGMIVAMYYNDHAPPHFHVRYGEQRAIIGIETLSVIGGRLSPKALGLSLNGHWGTSRSCAITGTWRGRTRP